MKGLVVVLCVVILAGCSKRPERELSQHPDLRDGKIEELEKAAQWDKPTGTVVVTTTAIFANQPFQPEELRATCIPASEIESDDLTDCGSAAWGLARTNFPAGHILRQSDKKYCGFLDNWRVTHRAKKYIAEGDLVTEENAVARYVRMAEENSTQDVLMRRAKHFLNAGQIIHSSDVGEELWDNIYCAEVPIRKGAVIDRTQVRKTYVKAFELELGVYADLTEPTEEFRAAKDIKAGTLLKVTDIQGFDQLRTSPMRNAR